MRRIFFCLALALLLGSCALPKADPLAGVSEIFTVIDMRMIPVRNGDVLTLDFLINTDHAKFSAEIDEAGKTVTLKSTTFGYYKLNYDLQRPLTAVSLFNSEQGELTIKMKLALKCSMAKVDTEKGFRIILQLQEEDRELTAMQVFGGWQKGFAAATRLTGVKNTPLLTVLTMDNIPVFSSGSNGNANYLDIYGVRIPAGNVKQKNVSSVEILDGKSRITFKNGGQFCIQDNILTLGTSCGGRYLSLFGFSKNKQSGTERFRIMLTGRPEITVKTQNGITAFGIKNVKLFGEGMLRFDDDAVTKVEVRLSGGLTWIVFLHDPAYKFRRFFSSDDVLNVVFFKG
ncbi:hypothetical protein [Seleniivibrio woodruffii]|uniref:hypothetical protein n=1 Tax=Seleniivibrio woodruffii TaxID=1078050 RepID=UPI0039E34CA4